MLFHANEYIILQVQSLTEESTANFLLENATRKRREEIYYITR